MARKQNPIIEKVYSAASTEESREAYDGWANDYEQDVLAYGARFPIMAAAAFTRFVDPGEGPVLDAGCGTGLQAEPLALMGYRPITGIDLSEGMLKVARGKGIYSELRRMTLGERLDFDDDLFAGVITTGAITPGHAPPHSFEELIRVTRPGGRVVISLRVDDDVDPAYPEAVERYAARGLWEKLFQSPKYPAMPIGEPEVECAIFVFRVC